MYVFAVCEFQIYVCADFKFVFCLCVFFLIPAKALVIDPNDFVKRTQMTLNDLWTYSGSFVILCLLVSSDIESFLVLYTYLWHFSMLPFLIDYILNWCKALLYICLKHTDSLNAVLYFRKKLWKWQIELPTGNRQLKIYDGKIVHAAKAE